MSSPPVIVWFRRDLRLSDHPALSAACASGAPVIALVIRDASVDALGAAPKWRWGLGVAHLAEALARKGAQLVCRSGAARAVLEALVAETGAKAVYWSRLYDPESVARDTDVKSALRARGVDARSYGGHLMFEPWTVQTKTGGFYRVYTPFWRTVKDRDVDVPIAAPARIPGPEAPIASDPIADWKLGGAMQRGAQIVRPHIRLGEEAAHDRLRYFCEDLIGGYDVGRDLPSADRTSNLSENLALGEISPHQCWHAGLVALHAGKAGAETFLKELVWREFAYHLMHHTPHILDSSWKPDWDGFAWNSDDGSDLATAWTQGRTGIQFVDAAMREMYVTGRMHNRGRMIVASYLTKHLLTHWRIGQKWFAQCLTDWDPASNAMGWQWSAGSGPDATPYFRVFNPVTQLDKFDKNRAYVSRWIAEGRANPHADALSYFDAIPRAWAMAPSDPYPAPVIAADVGRKRALTAYESRDF